MVQEAWYPLHHRLHVYRKPDSGKTSTIKAITNHTQRHIFSIPLNKVKTSKEPVDLLHNVKMKNKDTPLNRRLYIIEDIDAADLKDLVGERSKNKEEENKTNNNNDARVNMYLLNLIKSYGPLCKLELNTLTLAHLLILLDRVMEMDSRIADYNHPLPGEAGRPSH